MKCRPITVAVLLIVTVFILPLFARGSQSPMDEKPAYTNNFIKIKLSSDAARRSQLPTALYAESSAFGINELDQLLSVRGGTSIIRAHRKVKDQAWADKTGWDNWFLIRL
ncbi:MAG: hypothetical protein PHU99_04290, partial [Candidatus Cloacimonetes bacterium]|nr:hypothetical protein [Candidatus Cloacimonadota bacterium]